MKLDEELSFEVLDGLYVLSNGKSIKSKLKNKKALEILKTYAYSMLSDGEWIQRFDMTDLDILIAVLNILEEYINVIKQNEFVINMNMWSVCQEVLCEYLEKQNFEIDWKSYIKNNELVRVVRKREKTLLLKECSDHDIIYGIIIFEKMLMQKSSKMKYAK